MGCSLSTGVSWICSCSCSSLGLFHQNSAAQFEPSYAECMEQQLKDFAEERVTQNLTILYSDMRGLWGGVTITLSTSGAYEYLERTRGAIVPDMVRRTVTPAHVQEVIRLLLETRSWEQ